jgi:hypothetical protein
MANAPPLTADPAALAPVLIPRPTNDMIYTIYHGAR